MSVIDTQIRDRVDAFITEITSLVRETALDAVREAIGESGSPKRLRARRPTGKRGTAQVRKAAGRRGKRIRRTAEDLEQLSTQIQESVRKTPGQRLGEIAKGLGEETKDVRRPAFQLVEDGALRTEGERGGTRYFPGGRSAKKARSGKKATRKKKARRKRSKK